MHATVVIPTKNAMPRFQRVLQRVLEQETPWKFEIIIIDSGSNDGTVEFVRAQKRVRLITIAPEELGHGRTRNQAISHAAGEYISLLTQDAEPFDQYWLVNLVNATAQDARIAGSFGRHLAKPDSNPFTQRDLENHFNNFLNHPRVVDRHLDARKYREGDVGWRQFLHFFSDNNSCLRRSVYL